MAVDRPVGESPSVVLVDNGDDLDRFADAERTDVSDQPVPLFKSHGRRVAGNLTVAEDGKTAASLDAPLEYGSRGELPLCRPFTDADGSLIPAVTSGRGRGCRSDRSCTDGVVVQLALQQPDSFRHKYAPSGGGGSPVAVALI